MSSKLLWSSTESYSAEQDRYALAAAGPAAYGAQTATKKWGVVGENDFRVIAHGGNASVDVQPGYIYLPGTNVPQYLGFMDVAAVINLNATPGAISLTSGQKYIYLIYAQANDPNVVVSAVRSTAASNPAVPSLPTNAVALARVDVAYSAGGYIITSSMITDMRETVTAPGGIPWMTYSEFAALPQGGYRRLGQMAYLWNHNNFVVNTYNQGWRRSKFTDVNFTQYRFQGTNEVDGAGVHNAHGQPFFDLNLNNVLYYGADNVWRQPGPIWLAGPQIISGSAPTLQQLWENRLYIQGGTNSGTTNGTGDFTTIFPTPFPNGLISLIVSNGDGLSVPHAGPVIVDRNPTGFTTRQHQAAPFLLNGVNFSVLQGDGTPFPWANKPFRVNYLAIGW